MIFIGKLVQDKRKEKGITQAWLSNYFNYSETFFSKIENGQVPIPASIINELSRLLECDLNHIYMYSYIFSSYEEYCLYFDLKKTLLNSEAIDLLPKILENYDISEKILNSSTKSELYFMLVYVKALLLLDKNKKEVINFCSEHLEINLLNITDVTPTYDREIAIYTVLISALFDTGEQHLAFKISTYLYNYLSTRLESNYSHAEQNIELHNSFLNVINNHAHILFSLKQYNESLYFCDEAIRKSINYHLINKARGPYLIKLGNHYFLNQYEEALYCLEQLEFISNHSNNADFSELLEIIKVRYPNLFFKLKK